jgi:hypothetical protein
VTLPGSSLSEASIFINFLLSLHTVVLFFPPFCFSCFLPYMISVCIHFLTFLFVHFPFIHSFIMSSPCLSLFIYFLISILIYFFLSFRFFIVHSPFLLLRLLHCRLYVGICICWPVVGNFFSSNQTRICLVFEPGFHIRYEKPASNFVTMVEASDARMKLSHRLSIQSYASRTVCQFLLDYIDTIPYYTTSSYFLCSLLFVLFKPTLMLKAI